VSRFLNIMKIQQEVEIQIQALLNSGIGGDGKFCTLERNFQTRQIYFTFTDVTFYITVSICQYSTTVGYLFR
jgi:hypothetical protein